MRVNNISNKIISFGQVQLLPGDSAEIEQNPNVDALQSLGFISVVSDSPKGRNSRKQSDVVAE